MDEENETLLMRYLELFAGVKQKVVNDTAAAAIFQEIARDRRMQQIKPEQGADGDAPATDKQIGYLKRLGVQIPPELTKQRASEILDQVEAAKSTAAEALS